MSPRTSIMVTETEKHIIASLRELPEGKLRSKLEVFLIELTDFVREPKCAEVQADGIPCDDPTADCEQCLKVSELLTMLQSRLPNHAS